MNMYDKLINKAVAALEDDRAHAFVWTTFLLSQLPEGRVLRALSEAVTREAEGLDVSAMLADGWLWGDPQLIIAASRASDLRRMQTYGNGRPVTICGDTIMLLMGLRETREGWYDKVPAA